uniref:Uncharacterized protein n=1 Tax=Cucumis melo TaxID=3656 RepID=A0A9I9EM63_CUCME
MVDALTDQSVRVFGWFECKKLLLSTRPKQLSGGLSLVMWHLRKEWCTLSEKNLRSSMGGLTCLKNGTL